MMNIERIVKAVIPNADNYVINYILWDMTPYPIGQITPKMVYKAASIFQRAKNNKRRLCLFCPNEVKTDDWECPKCREALNLGKRFSTF